jgi:hypothetical protein
MNPKPTRHNVVELFVKHTDQAEKRFSQMGLFQSNPLVGMATPCHPLLVAKKHFPGYEDILSPCNGR